LILIEKRDSQRADSLLKSICPEAIPILPSLIANAPLGRKINNTYMFLLSIAGSTELIEKTTNICSIVRLIISILGPILNLQDLQEG